MQTQPSQGQASPGACLPVGMSAASLICGLCAVALVWVPFVHLATLPLSIVAIVLGAVSICKCNKGEAGGKGMAIAGLILGIAGLLLLPITTAVMLRLWRMHMHRMHHW